MEPLYKKFYQEPKSVLLLGQAEEPFMVLVATFISKTVVCLCSNITYKQADIYSKINKASFYVNSFCNIPHCVAFNVKAEKAGNNIMLSTICCKKKKKKLVLYIIVGLIHT